MAWAGMAASGTGSAMFIDDVTHDGSSEMNSEDVSFCLPIYREMHQNFIMQLDGGAEHNANFIGGEEWKVLDWSSQLSELNLAEYASDLLKKRLKAEMPKRKLNETIVKTWKNITKEETNYLVSDLLSRRLDAVIKAMHTQPNITFNLFFIKF